VHRFVLLRFPVFPFIAHRGRERCQKRRITGFLENPRDAFFILTALDRAARP
jgi:hypothetical protein